MGREEVVAEEDQAWSALIDAIDTVPSERRDEEGVVPGWSTHDVVWHTAYWVRQGRDAVRRIRLGQPEPADEEATEAENAAITAEGRTMSWAAVIDALERERASARESLEAFDGDVPQRALEFFSDYTADHYREHESQIHAFAPRSGT